MRPKVWLLLGALVVLLAVLQYRLWTSFIEVRALEREIAGQKVQLHALQARNQALRAEVESLRKDDDAVEARARKELGLIREGETYFQLIQPERGANE